MPQVSIIIPVYKAEKYIRRCIDSVIAQTFSNWECILVDDGSPDRSGEICDEYAKNDSRIFAFHKKNGGANDARRYGVEKSSGEWIHFIDSDDYIYPFALQKLIDSSSNVDIVEGLMEGWVKLPKLQYDIEEYRKLCILGDLFHTGPVAKLYRKSLFDLFCFDIPREIDMGEDYIMRIRLAFNTEKPVNVVNEYVYNYDLNPTSVSYKYHYRVDVESLYIREIKASIPDKLKVQYSKETTIKGYIIFKTLLYRNCSKLEFDEIWTSPFFSTFQKDVADTYFKFPNKRVNFYFLFPSHSIIFYIIKLDKILQRIYHFLKKLCMITY